MAVERADSSLEARLARLERLVEELAARPVTVHVHVPEIPHTAGGAAGARGMGGCVREAILRLLVKLRRDLARDLRGWPEARAKALERLAVYQAELEELLAEEPTYGG